MKHILRKLHIGGGSVVNEQQQQQQQNRINESSNSNSNSNSSSTPSESLPSSYTLSATSTFPSSSEGEGRVHGESDQSPVDYNFFEEEFQVQLALAISASDTQVKEDRESAQIKVAKEISLGFPSTGSSRETLATDVSLRYWNYNVVDYDERLLNGFYDVCGITSDSLMQGKMPLLVDLLATTVSDNVEYEVILVDRSVDRALQQLEKSAHSLVQECHASKHDPISSGLVRKLADLVVDRMGGPVHDTEEMLTRWKVRSYELQSSLNTIVLPLGCLDIGLSRHRALLFKVLADRINLPCRLVKGSYYTGTDEGAVSLIKTDYEGEYIIDLMGAPGVLIPAEIPSNNFQNFGVDLMGSLPIKKTAQDLCLAFDKVNHESDMRIGSSEGNSHAFDAGESDRSGSNDASALGIQMKENNENHAKKDQTERFEYDFGKLFPSLQRSNEGTSGTSVKNSPAQKVQVKDVSNCVISAAQNPEFAQKLHTVLLENRVLPPELLAALASPQDMREHKANVDSGSMNENTLDDDGGRQANCFFNQVLYENNNKHYSDEMLKKQEDATCYTKHKFHEPCSTDKTDFGRDHHVEGNTDVSSQADSCREHHRNPMEHGAQASHSNEGRISIIGNTHTNCLQEYQQGSEESKGILARTVSCDPEITRNPHNEWLNSMLDEVGDWEIPWEDIQIGERIGIGSYGEVYHADWNGTEVAVKRFLIQDFSGDALEQLRCEVGIMLRLRHPNVVLFMGAVTRPPNLSILTEFLPRGSLCKLLHRPNIQLDEKRRLRMALDVAKGMNYLHTSNPTIVHRDLKSPNLLVDKNWVVKVCDFGLSRLKHHTYLSSKSMAGTELQPEWMAPEVLRNEPSNEKCDVYSFGVILWELATLRLPWSGMNPMQVVGAVGFQNRHLDIPDDIDPMVAQIIRDCWHSNPDLRPSFSQLMSLLKRTKHLLVPKT